VQTKHGAIGFDALPVSKRRIVRRLIAANSDSESDVGIATGITGSVRFRIAVAMGVSRYLSTFHGSNECSNPSGDARKTNCLADASGLPRTCAAKRNLEKMLPPIHERY